MVERKASRLNCVFSNMPLPVVCFYYCVSVRVCIIVCQACLPLGEWLSLTSLTTECHTIFTRVAFLLQAATVVFFLSGRRRVRSSCFLFF